MEHFDFKITQPFIKLMFLVINHFNKDNKDNLFKITL